MAASENKEIHIRDLVVDELDRQGLLDFHAPRLEILAASGADLLACETIPSALEVEVVTELLGRHDIPAWVSCSCRDGRHLNDGTPLAEVAARLARAPGVFAVGVNCTAPRHISSLVGIIREAAPANSSAAPTCVIFIS